MPFNNNLYYKFDKHIDSIIDFASRAIIDSIIKSMPIILTKGSERNKMSFLYISAFDHIYPIPNLNLIFNWVSK